MPRHEDPKTLLGFDFGMKKIGVAVGQSLTKTATPLDRLPTKDGIPNWDSIKELIETWKTEGFVVGIPYNMDGSEQEVTFAAKKFGNRLQAKFNLPVFFVDERLTTVEAKSNLGHASSHNLDSYAAKLILETWFREHDDQKS